MPRAFVPAPSPGTSLASTALCNDLPITIGPSKSPDSSYRVKKFEHHFLILGASTVEELLLVLETCRRC